ncbi:MAG: hypothetical protein M3021_00055 [Actinomycetota bacterium]|nr:hypothetical protein [Actinomycetota bacterium]
MQQALLTLADLPDTRDGWQALEVDPVRVESPSIRACGQPLFSFPNAPSDNVAFSKHGFPLVVAEQGGLPVIILEGIVLPVKGTAPAEFDRLAVLFRDCTAFVDLDQPRYKISVTPLPFPLLGDQSAAFSLETTERGTPRGINSIALVRYGDYLVILTQQDLLPGDLTEFELIARTAVQKLSVLPR